MTAAHRYGTQEEERVWGEDANCGACRVRGAQSRVVGAGRALGLLFSRDGWRGTVWRGREWGRLGSERSGQSPVPPGRPVEIPTLGRRGLGRASNAQEPRRPPRTDFGARTTGLNPDPPPPPQRCVTHGGAGAERLRLGWGWGSASPGRAATREQRARGAGTVPRAAHPPGACGGSPRRPTSPRRSGTPRTPPGL